MAALLVNIYSVVILAFAPPKKSCIWSDVAPESATAVAATSCSYGTYTFLAHRYGDVYCVAVSEDTFSTIFFARGVLVNIPVPVHKKRPCIVKTQILLDSPEVEVQDDLRLICIHSTYILHISN